MFVYTLYGCCESGVLLERNTLSVIYKIENAKAMESEEKKNWRWRDWSLIAYRELDEGLQESTTDSKSKEPRGEVEFLKSWRIAQEEGLFKILI